MQAFGDVALHRMRTSTKGYTTARKKVLNATGYYSWAPSDTQLKEIAELTYSQDFNVIMETLRIGLINLGFNCGQISKCLTVLNYCLEEGSENVAIYFHNNINAIKDLREFRYIDKGGKDHGADVRQKAIDILNLLQYEPLFCAARNHATRGSDSEDVDSYTASKDFINESIPSIVWNSERSTSSLNLVQVKPLNTTSSFANKPEEAGIPKSSIDEIKILEHSSEGEFELRLLRSLKSVFRRDTGFKIGSEAQDPDHRLSMLSMLCRLLVDTVLGYKARNRKLLAYRGQDAQKALNLMQMLLDHSPLEAQTRHAFIIALRKLSQKSRLYPQCFTLRDVTRGENAVTVGRHSEIFKGTFRGQVICLNVVKLDQKLYVESHLKACLQEAILWGYLSHPNLLPFYGMYRLDDNNRQICLVSPWMNNGNIIEYLAHSPDVSRLLLVRDTVAGILYLHENDIVHGDLKGTNILVTSSGRACLEKGTVNIYRNERWQAPELSSLSLKDFKSKSTKASDIYAFASVCYEIFTGMVPFYKVARDNAVTSHVMSGERPRLPEITLRVKNGLTDNIWVLMQDCWETDPVHRPTIQTISRRLSMDGLMLDDRSVDGEEALASTEFRKAMHSAADHFSYEDLRDISTWLPDL